jgi:hypothetical protein
MTDARKTIRNRLSTMLMGAITERSSSSAVPSDVASRMSTAPLEGGQALRRVETTAGEYVVPGDGKEPHEHKVGESHPYGEKITKRYLWNLM